MSAVILQALSLVGSQFSAISELADLLYTPRLDSEYLLNQRNVDLKQLYTIDRDKGPDYLKSSQPPSRP